MVEAGLAGPDSVGQGPRRTASVVWGDRIIPTSTHIFNQPTTIKSRAMDTPCEPMPSC